MSQCFLLDSLQTPLGELLLITDARHHLCAVEWQEKQEALFRVLSRRYKDDPFQLQSAYNPGGLTEALRRYFAGELSVLDTLPVAAMGTPFQHQVWQALRQIPCGTTMSYGELAVKLGRPGASRAVGMAKAVIPSVSWYLATGLLAPMAH